MLFESRRRRLALALACSFIGLSSSAAWGLPRTWIGGNVDWLDGGSTANWTPADEPDADDEAIFNTANSVNLGSNNAINGLTMSGGIDLSTSTFALSVDGLVSTTGAGTNLFLNTGGSVNADDVTIGASSFVDLRGGTLTLDQEVGTSLLTINAGGTIIGTGTVSFADAPGVSTMVLNNNGTLSARSVGVTLFTPPPVGTLTISGVTGNAKFDLDGTSETGVVNVFRNQTLAINGVLPFDAFNSQMNLFHNSTLDISSGWTLGNGGVVNINNGFVAGVLPFPDTPADVAYLRTGASISVNAGGVINVVDTDGTLQIDSNLTLNGTLNNAGTVIFNGVTNINTAAGYDPTDVNSQTIVNADVTINDAAGNFNWDGNGAADTTINGAATLSITANQIDTGDNVFGGTITLDNGGDLNVNNTANSWTLGGTLEKIGPSVSTVSGDPVTINGTLTAGGTGTLSMPATTLASGSSVTVDSTLELGGHTIFAGPSSVSGIGTLRVLGTSAVSANTTVAVATFDWDGGTLGHAHTINAGVVFTINSPTLDTDGDMDDPFTLSGNGSQLIVNGPAQWTATGVITANPSGAGTATIGGTSRMILTGTMNVDGDTNVNAPVTFGAGSTTSIDAGKTLNVGLVNATYAGGTISGAGTYSPGSTNTVTGVVTINVSTVDFDGGSWTIDTTGDLNINSADYDTTGVNTFEGTINNNSGRVDPNTGDPSFVMNGTLNMNGVPGDSAFWDGEALQIGDDAGALDANLNVIGTGAGSFQTTSVTFNSDADVDVAGGASLRFLSATPVTFNTVNGANNAEFTGAGTIEFTGNINVNEAVTFNMPGGTIDFDSLDATGATFNIDAPMTLNVASVLPVGNNNTFGGPDTFEFNNSTGTGVLTVNLDNPASEWTLNGPGVMNLVNDNSVSTLLAGSAVNLNGTVNVTGDVRSTARLDIAGVVNINTAAQPFRLGGGTTAPTNTNRLIGGTISGVGTLGADADTALRGFGTINTQIDFDSNANLFAEDGTLTINGAILDVNTLGTGNGGGVLNIQSGPWNTSGAPGGIINAVELNGGTLQGQPVTNDNPNGIAGFGTVTLRVFNNTALSGRSGTLVFQTAANDNDWDGTGSGSLRAAVGSTLELRDVGAAFPFSGNVTALTGGRVFTNGFALNFGAASSIVLTAATYESTASTDISGSVTVNAGAASTIKVANNSFLDFLSGSATTLNGNLNLDNNNINIRAGATFSGTGALVLAGDDSASLRNTAVVNVLLVNGGTVHTGAIGGVGRADVRDYQQGASGTLVADLSGPGLAQFDRLLVTGNAQLAGTLDLNVLGGYTPAYLAQHTILTSLGLSGSFATVQGVAVSPTRYLAVTYTATAVNVTATLPGDANVNGTVNFDDLLLLAANYNGSSKTWSLGDFTGDGLTNFDDLLLLAANYNQSIPGTPEWAMAQASVPEPATIALLAPGVLVLRRRR